MVLIQNGLKIKEIYMENQDKIFKLITEKWFPTTIGIIDCPFLNEVKTEYLNIVSKLKYTENGFCDYYIHNDIRFIKLNNWIKEQVNKYAELHKFKHIYEAKDSWVIDYPLNIGQPFHCHNGYTISVCFFLDGDTNDVPLIFKNPVQDMKNPLDINSKNAHLSGNLFNEFTNQRCVYTPLSGRLIIFRSHSEHGVDPKKTLHKRIIFSYNFDPI